MHSIPEVVEKLGGATFIAKQMNKPAMTTVASWKIRGVIPVQYWPGLIKIARQRGLDWLTYERLVELHTERAA